MPASPSGPSRISAPFAPVVEGPHSALLVEPGGVSGVTVALLIAALVLVLAVAGFVWRSRGDRSSANERSLGGDGGTSRDPAVVRRLLAANGGQMRRRELVDAVDWPPSEVRAVVDDLEGEGVVSLDEVGDREVVRLGGD